MSTLGFTRSSRKDSPDLLEQGGCDGKLKTEGLFVDLPYNVCRGSGRETSGYDSFGNHSFAETIEMYGANVTTGYHARNLCVAFQLLSSIIATSISSQCITFADTKSNEHWQKKGRFDRGEQYLTRVRERWNFKWNLFWRRPRPANMAEHATHFWKRGLNVGLVLSSVSYHIENPYNQGTASNWNKTIKVSSRLFAKCVLDTHQLVYPPGRGPTVQTEQKLDSLMTHLLSNVC